MEIWACNSLYSSVWWIWDSRFAVSQKSPLLSSQHLDSIRLHFPTARPGLSVASWWLTTHLGNIPGLEVVEPSQNSARVNGSQWQESQTALPLMNVWLLLVANCLFSLESCCFQIFVLLPKLALYIYIYILERGTGCQKECLPRFLALLGHTAVSASNYTHLFLPQCKPCFKF